MPNGRVHNRAISLDDFAAATNESISAENMGGASSARKPVVV